MTDITICSAGHSSIDGCTCDPGPEQEAASFTAESFIAAVAEIEIHDDNGGPYALDYAVTNTLYGRGTLDKVTRRTVANAIRTLQAVIRDARLLNDEKAKAAHAHKAEA